MACRGHSYAGTRTPNALLRRGVEGEYAVVLAVQCARKCNAKISKRTEAIAVKLHQYTHATNEGSWVSLMRVLLECK